MKKKTKYYLLKVLLMVFGLALIGVGGYLAWAEYKIFWILGHIIFGIAVILGTFGNNLIDIIFFVPKGERKKYFFRLFGLFGFSIVYISLLLIFIKQSFIQEYGIFFVYGIWLFNALMALIFFVKIKANFGVDSEEPKSTN